MTRICPACNEGKIIRKTIEIPVGREHFSTEADVCEKCGAYKHTPAIQKEMDKWGESFNRNFIDVQPRLSDVEIDLIENEAKKYAIDRSDLIRIFTVFYLDT